VAHMSKLATAVITVGFVLGSGFSLLADPIGSAGSGGSTPTGAAGDPVVGTTDTGNCVPFGCDAEYGITTYQQVYSSSAFTGTTPFNQISFFLYPFGGTPELDSGTYTIYFSYTSASVNGLSDSSPSANIGADETLFGTYTLTGGAAPATLTFNGSAFDYDPTMGNLLMTIDISGAVDGISAYFDTDDTGTVTSRAYFGTTTGADPNGLVTDFNDVPVATPEPASVLLLIGVAACVAPKLRKAYRHTA
jgi:hypothetical protein